MNRFTLSSIIILLICMAGCDSGGVGGIITDDLPVLKILSPTHITESGFQLNWSVSNKAGYQAISVQVAEDEDMDRSVAYFQIDDLNTENYLIENLHGATSYYYKISLLDNGSSLVESQIKSVDTYYKVESFDLQTEDSYSLTAKLAYLESVSGSRPGIIMMHEFGVWVNPWIGSDLMKLLVADGYVCLTFFNRGHGTSTPMDDIMDLINDKSLLGKDLQAAIDYMNEHELVSGTLGLIGGSMGAIMALAGNGYDEVLSSVALSPTRDGVFVIFPNMTLSSVYYLVGELDIRDQLGGNFPAEANALYDLTEEPRKLNIITGTDAHGTNLLSRDSLNISIEEWFLDQLPMQ